MKSSCGFLFLLCVFFSCKTSEVIQKAEWETPTCAEDIDCIGLEARAGSCEAAILYMQSVLDFESVNKVSKNAFEVAYRLRGIDNSLLSDSRYLQFHIAPYCLTGMDYNVLMQLSPDEAQLVASVLQKQKQIKLSLTAEGEGELIIDVSKSGLIRQARWANTIEADWPKDTLTNYYLDSLGSSMVSIAFVRAVTGPSRKTISTKNRTLLVVTNINGDGNTLGLRSLSPCYFSSDHFINLGINAFLDVFDIESLDEASIALISNIVVNIHGHSQLIMKVNEGIITDFRYN